MDQERLNYLMSHLQEEGRNGKIKISVPEVMDSLMKVKYLSDGQNVDPSTVDGRIRSLALTIEAAKYHKQLLSVPLRESQEQYFNILDHFFGTPFHEMRKHNLTPYQVATSMSRMPNMVKAFQDDREAFEEGLKKLWNYYAPVIQAHVTELKGINSVYGGDIFPSYTRNIAHSSGLYVDTIILPDPLLRTCRFFEQMPPERALYYLAKHALNAMQYKELALADVDMPIVIIAPDENYLDEDEWTILREVSEENVLSHVNKLFGTSFSSQGQAENFLKNLHTTDDLLTVIRRSDRLLFDTDWNEDLPTQIEKWKREIGENFTDLKEKTLGIQLRTQVIGRMMQINDIVLRSMKFNGAPIMDAQTSWQYLLWKYEYDSQKNLDKETNIKNILVSNALTNIDLPIIGNLTDKSIIHLRKEGALQDLRELVAKGIEDVSLSSIDNFSEVTDHVFINLKEAFEKHQKKIVDLGSRKKNFYGLDLLPMLVSGGLGIAAACTGNPILGSLAAGSAALFGAPSAKEVIKKGSELSSESKNIAKSPVGILISHSR